MDLIRLDVARTFPQLGLFQKVGTVRPLTPLSRRVTTVTGRSPHTHPVR